MAKLTTITAGHYRIPLDTPLSDSTHGTMTAFELVTVRVRDADGAEGTGYTYTTGHNGAAIHSILSREIPEIVTKGMEIVPVSRLTLSWVSGSRAAKAV